MTERLTPVTWLRHGAGGWWTKEHYTRDQRRTLCGVRIPQTYEVLDIRFYGFGVDACTRCTQMTERTS